MAIHQPHDHLFKRVFGVPAEAASFLRARLPAPLSRSLHWPTLKRHPDSFVTPDLRGAASDLLFEVRYAEPGADTAPLWLYLLFEHQSTPDFWLRLRLLGYCCRIWERDRRDHKEARHLRPILPLVFYQGPTGWRPSRQFADLFPAGVRDWPWLPRFEHLLFDQTKVSPAQAAGSVRARLLLQLTMMHAFSRSVREARQRMGRLLEDLEREGSGGQDDMKMFVRYILETGPEDTPEEMGEQLSRTAAGGELMTSGERLREEGRREGRLEGQRELMTSGERLREEGRREGRLEGQRELKTSGERLREEGRREGRLEGQRELKTSGERLRQEGRDEMRAVAEQRHREGRLEGQHEGRLEGQREGRLEAIDGLLRTGVDWSVIERATGIGEQEYRQLRSRPNGAAAAGGDGT